MIARYDPHKDHINLLKVFNKVIKNNNKIILILIGKNIKTKHSF